MALSIKGSLLKPIQQWDVESKIEGRDYLGDSKATFSLHSRYSDTHLKIDGQSLYFGIPKNIHIEGPIDGPYSFDVDSVLFKDKISGKGMLLLDLKEKILKANANLDYQGKKHPYAYSLSCKEGISLSIFSKEMIDLSLSYQNSIIMLERCFLSINGYVLKSQKPVTIDFQKGSVSDAFFIINDAPLELKGIKFQKDLQGSIQLTDLNLEKIPANDLALKGKIRLKANLLGDVKSPKCQFIVNALNVTQEHQKAVAPLSFDIKGDASLRETTFVLSLLKHPSKIDLQAKGKVFYDTRAPTLDASLKADFDCQHLKSFVSKRDILAGKVKSNLNLKGPLVSPQVEGTVDIEKGHYSNALIATTLKDLKGTIKLQGSRITPNLVGHDDFSGTLTVVGEYDYLKKSGDIIAKFNRFYLGQSDLFTGCGSGDVVIRPSDESITGTILLHKVIVDLDQLSPSGIPTLRKIEKEEGHGETADSSLKVKIILKPEKYLLLRGFGIEESLWEGQLILQGVPLKFLGKFNLFKGNVELADKVFKFTRGEVVFDGSIKTPLLDAEVMRKIGGYNVKIQLAGRPKEPKLFFLSEPALTQEEILSLILFGKTTPSGSVGELIDLSSTLSTLHRQGGEGFFTQFRKVFGIESLEFKKGEKITSDNQVNETNSVSIRKQLTPNISLNFEQSLGHSSATESKATLSTDITENLNVEVDVGSNKSGGVGLMWTQRY
jgi:translocation and assembly module TamB